MAKYLSDEWHAIANGLAQSFPERPGVAVRMAYVVAGSPDGDRKYFQVIDNGNHFVAAGNTAVMTYLDRIGARGSLAGEAEARFDFVDVSSGERWALRLNGGRVPWWVFSGARRVPGTTARDYMRLATLLRDHGDATLGQVVPTGGPLWDRMLDTFFRSPPSTRRRPAG